MIKGVGVDIVKISRFNDVSEHFINRILTKEEYIHIVRMKESI